jgi:hypothetical protein
MDPITLALIAVKGAVGIGKAIAGGVQKRRAAKELDKQTPQYSRPEEYSKILSIFQQQAGLSELPGQSATEEKLSAATARGTRAIGKYADSSVAAVAASAGLYGKEQGAIRDLGIQFSQFKNRAQSQLADAYKMGADYSDKEFSYNQWYPDQMRRNMAAQKWNGGQQNLWGGLDQVAGAGLDYATAKLGAPSDKTDKGGIGTNANNTSWLQGNANAASMPNNLAALSVNPGTVTDFSSLYNPTYAGQFIPNLGTPVPSSYYNGK